MKTGLASSRRGNFDQRRKREELNHEYEISRRENPFQAHYLFPREDGRKIREIFSFLIVLFFLLIGVEKVSR